MGWIIVQFYLYLVLTIHIYICLKNNYKYENILLSNYSTLFFDPPVNKHVFAFGVERGYVGLNLFFNVFDLGARRAGFNPRGNIPSPSRFSSLLQNGQN